MGNKVTMWLILGVSLLTLSVWTVNVGQWQSKNLKVVFCDVGQGDAFVVSLGSYQMLVDGGPGSKVLDCLDSNMPLGDKSIELVVATHPDKDHIGGILDVLSHYRVDQFATTPAGKETQVYARLLSEIDKLQQSGSLIVNNLYAGDVIRMGEIKIVVVWPERSWVSDHLKSDLASENMSQAVLGVSTADVEVNDFSLVLHVQYGDFDVLLNGDAESGIQDEELQAGLVPENVVVMSEPHHGSSNGFTEEWLSVVSPEMSVISVGAKNTYGHPAKETLSRLDLAGVEVLRTDELGNIVIESDGVKWWVRD